MHQASYNANKDKHAGKQRQTKQIVSALILRLNSFSFALKLDLQISHLEPPSHRDYEFDEIGGAKLCAVYTFSFREQL